MCVCVCVAQFQNKYASQRALLRNGEHLTNSLVVGVKPLDPRHRAAVEGYDATHGSPVQVRGGNCACRSARTAYEVFVCYMYGV